ncbi:MAG: hypothetical protein ACI391_06385, partial [Muribaculaceae bacterium]
MIPLQNYIKKTTFIHHPVKNIKNYNKREFMAKICWRGNKKELPGSVSSRAVGRRGGDLLSHFRST